VVYLLCLLPLLFCLTATVQNPSRDQETRQIIPEEFVKSRPSRSTASPAKRATYRPISSRSGPASGGSRTRAPYATQLGLTIWRLRRSDTGDTGARIIVHHDQETEEWTPERVESNTPLRMGERIRLSFESPQTGYLYLIDREQYANGSIGEPYLIFPTTRTRDGDHQVTAGKIIEVPGQEDRPNFFTLRQTRPDQTGEQLIVIVAPQPIPGMNIGDKPLKLSNEQVEQWEKQWGAMTEKFEMSGGAGKTWTKAEQEAGASQTRQLTQDEPSPQTIYRVAAQPGTPILVKVGLRYNRSKIREGFTTKNTKR
jgi:Domain of unknown function (DUF4384)